jgi:nucleoside diphosphate kinase
MSDELAYVLITPYSLLKSRTGGIISRLLSLTGNLDFVGARMYAPSDELVRRFEETLGIEDLTDFAHDALHRYVREAMPRNNRFGISNRMIMLLFRGQGAVASLQQVIGQISPNVHGYTIRGTYGDVVTDQEGRLVFCEPALLAPTTTAANRAQLKLMAEFAMTDGGIFERIIRFPDGVAPQTTLVIIKPDNFARKSARPGNIIDMFSRTGLYIVGVKLIHMSLEQAKEFYGPLRRDFVTRLVPVVGDRLRASLRDAFEFPISDEQYELMANVLADSNAEHEFSRIVSYMTGMERNPWAAGETESGICLALLYQGENSIEKIRERLGATNPDKAQPGTVRSTYGHDLMKNGAHASDSPENAQRERRIIGMWQEGETCEFQQTILEYLRRS